MLVLKTFKVKPLAVISVLSTQMISTSWCFTTTRSTFKDHAKTLLFKFQTFLNPKLKLRKHQHIQYLQLQLLPLWSTLIQMNLCLSSRQKNRKLGMLKITKAFIQSRFHVKPKRIQKRKENHVWIPNAIASFLITSV